MQEPLKNKEGFVESWQIRDKKDVHPSHIVKVFYEEEVQQIMDTLPTIIEPLIIILLAIVIGGMAVAIIMPMYSLTNAF